MPPKVIVIDLDGTLLNTNTFHRWMIFLFKKSLLKSPLDSIKIIKIILLRLLKSYTHKEMKYHILQISESKQYKNHIDEFVDELDIYLNKTVLAYVQIAGSVSILATAAPELYAKTLSLKYGFRYCIATPDTEQKAWFENIKEKKRESLQKLLNSIDLQKVDIVLSDHHDDIFIMEMAEEIFLVNPTLETKSILQNTMQNIQMI